MYKGDLDKLSKIVTPPLLRKTNMGLLVSCLVFPLMQVYNLFVVFIQAKQYRIKHNSQVCYMRAVLNDTFDNDLRRVAVGDFAGIERIFFYPYSENLNVYFDTNYFYPNDSYADSGIDFTISVPSDINLTGGQLAYFNSLVNDYKLAGKNYNIVRI